MMNDAKQWSATIARMTAIAVLGCVWALAPSPVEARGVYTVAKVTVDVTAKDAVTAKRTGLDGAKKSALRTVFKRIAPFSAYDRLPVAKTSLIDDMLENFTVRREQNSATRYLATLDFEFNADAIRRFLSAHNVPNSDIQAPSAKLLPVFVEKGQVVSTGRDSWRRAWLELDLAHAVTPLRLASHGTSLTSETLSTILTGDGFADLQEKYKTSALILAVAEVAEDGARINVRLYGSDAAGSVALAYPLRSYDGDQRDATRRAARLTLRVLESRWKVTQTIDATDQTASAQHSVLLTVEFASLRQWQDIRARLRKIPGIQALEVGSLSARSADITFRFPGGVQAFSGKLSQHNMVLTNLGGVLVLRSN